MAHHPRIETAERSSFITTRTQNSQLWFINNRELEKSILTFAACYSTRRSVKLYALAIQGNHIHIEANFPLANRADFMRDFNSMVAKSVENHVKEFLGGRVWGRRYADQFLSDNETLEDKFFYTVLQPVNDGLTETIGEYPGYNCFSDAVNGVKRKFKMLNNAAYQAALRYNPNAKKIDYVQTYELEFHRLPGYEELTQSEYSRLMHKKLEERRLKIVAARKAEGLGFAGRTNLLKIKPGSIPYDTKTSTIDSFRPRVFALENDDRAKDRKWYFAILDAYKQASLEFRAGNLNAVFPPGTYRPHLRVLPPQPD